MAGDKVIIKLGDVVDPARHGPNINHQASNANFYKELYREIQAVCPGLPVEIVSDPSAGPGGRTVDTLDTYRTTPRGEAKPVPSISNIIDNLRSDWGRWLVRK